MSPTEIRICDISTLPVLGIELKSGIPICYNQYANPLGYVILEQSDAENDGFYNGQNVVSIKIKMIMLVRILNNITMNILHLQSSAIFFSTSTLSLLYIPDFSVYFSLLVPTFSISKVLRIKKRLLKFLGHMR